MLPDFEAGFTKFQAIEHILKRIQACEHLQNVCEHGQSEHSFFEQFEQRSNFAPYPSRNF